MGGFNNPITGGSGILEYPQIQSPNFVHGASGWRIGKNGTAEFQSVIIPSGSGGARIFVQSSAPSGPNTGDLWVQTSSGNEVAQWSGSAWVSFQWGTGSIQANAITAALIAANTITAAQIAAGTITATQIAAATITAAKLAAGIVVAGIVDGTTITGATIIADGTSGELLVYSGAPATGNLIASISGAPGTDSHSNSFLAGITSYVNTGGAPGLVTELFNGIITFFDDQSADTITHNAAIGHIHQTPAGSAPVAFLDGPSTNASGLHPSIWMIGEPAGTANAKVLLWNGVSETTFSALVAGTLQFATVSGGLASGSNSLTAGSGGEFEFDHDLLVGTGGSTTSLVRYSQDASGYPVVTDSSGLALNNSGSEPARPGPAAVTTTALTTLGSITVPGGDVEAGTTFQLHAGGRFSTGATPPSSATFSVIWSATTLASLAIPGGPAANLSGAGWYADAEINWLSTTQASIVLKVGWHTASGASGSAAYFTTANVSGLVTNASKNMVLDFQWGSAPGGQSLVCDMARFGRVA